MVYGCTVQMQYMMLYDVRHEDGHNHAGQRRKLHEARDHRIQVGREIEHIRVEACILYSVMCLFVRRMARDWQANRRVRVRHTRPPSQNTRATGRGSAGPQNSAAA